MGKYWLPSRTAVICLAASRCRWHCWRRWDATVERPLLLYIRPVELLSAAAPPRVPMRDQAQRVELTTGLARLRVSVPNGNIVQVAARGTDTVHIGVRVETLDAMERPADSTALLLVAEPIAGSLADWSPTADQPQTLSETDERGVFSGRLSVRLGADDVTVRLRIGVAGFEMGSRCRIDGGGGAADSGTGIHCRGGAADRGRG